MTKFRELIHLAKYYVAAGLLATACSLPSPQKNDKAAADSGGASFIIGNTSGTSRTVTNSQSLNIPQSRSYELKVCLQDRAFLKPLTLQQVNVKESNQMLWTDAAGCLVWTEEVPFNYFDDPHWIEIDKHLEGQGYQQGTATLKIAVNPWELPGDSTEVLDLKSISLDQLNLKKSTTSTPPRIFVKSFKIEKLAQNLQNDGLQVKHLLRIEPVIERKNIKGDIVQVPLQGSQLQAQLQILQGTPIFDENVQFLYKDGSWQTTLSLVHTDVSTETKTDATMQLTDDVLKNYVASSKFNLGTGSDWVQGAEGKTYSVDSSNLANDVVRHLSKSIKTASGDLSVATPNSTSSTSESSPILIDQLKGQILRVVEDAEVHRKVQVQIQTCLKNKITGGVLNKTQLTVHNWNSDALTVMTDDKGCINLEDSYSFDETSCHTYKMSSLKFGLPNGASIEVPIYIYPWSSTNTIIDARYTDSAALKTQCSEQKSATQTGPSKDLLNNKIQVSPLDQFMTTGNLLELHVNKKLRFEISPLVQVQGDSDGQFTYKPVRDETWTAEVIMQNPFSFSNVKKVVYDIQDVKSLSGLIQWEIDFETNDLQIVDGAVDVFVRLQNKSGTHTSGVLRGHLLMNSRPYTINVSDDSTSWDSLLAWAKQQDEIKNKDYTTIAQGQHVQKYASVNRLNVVDQGFFKDVGLENFWQLKNMYQPFQGNSDLAGRFCEKWVELAFNTQKTVFTRDFALACSNAIQKDVRTIFRLTPIYEVTKAVESKILPSESGQSTVTVGTALAAGFGYSTSWHDGYGVKGGVQGQVGGNSLVPSIMVGAGLEAGYEIGFSQAWSKEKILRQSVSENKNINVAHYVTQTTAETDQRCVAIQINPQLFAQKQKPLLLRLWDYASHPNTTNLTSSLEHIAGSKNILNLSKGVLVCEADHGRYYLKDDYYLLSESRIETALDNPTDGATKPWFISVRGKGDYQQLLSLMMAKIENPVNTDYSSNNIQHLLFETNYFESANSVPGIWVTPPQF